MRDFEMQCKLDKDVIKSEGYNAGELFSAFSFEVPIYQRVFAWEEEQFERLFHDLTQHFCLRKNSGRYYLGVITVVRPKAGDRLILVDGQQRLTCILLLGALLGWNLDRNKLGYAARPADRNAIDVVYSVCGAGKSPSPEEIEKIGNIAMTGFVRYATGKGRDMLSDLFSESENIKANLTLMVSMLPDEPYRDNIFEQNRYFEKMNNGGKQLEPHEILKVQMCEGLDGKCLKDWNGVADFGKRFTEAKSDTETLPASDLCPLSAVLMEAAQKEGAEEEALLRRVRERCGDKTLLQQYEQGDEPHDDLRKGPVSFVIFLLHVRFLFLKTVAKQSDVTLGDESNLLPLFHELTCRPPEERKQFVEIMKDYRRFVDSRIIHLVTMDTESRYAFYEDDGRGGIRDAAPEERRTMLQFQSMLYVSSDTSQRWILEAYDDLKDATIVDDNVLFARLKQQDAQRHPTLQEEAVASWRYPAIDRYWFWKLDYLLWECHESDKNAALFADLHEEADHDAIAQYVFRRDRSIEHLHPQNPPPTGEGNDWKEDREKHGDAARDGFGNLAMIASSFNSSQGNDSISTKMGRIDDQVREKRLQSTKLLLMVRSVQSNPQGWTVKASRDHEEKMFKLLGVRLNSDA